MLFIQGVSIAPFFPEGSLLIWNALALVVSAAVLILPLQAGLILSRSRGRMETTHVLIWTAVIIFAPFIGSIVWLFFGRTPS